MGMTIPKQYGGQSRSYHDTVVVIEEIARCCATMGRITVEANMGAIGAVMKYGSENQKRLAADYVLSGDKPAICITEPNAGSAATEMTTTAVKRGNVYVLNGQKYWITGGGVSQLRRRGRLQGHGRRRRGVQGVPLHGQGGVPRLLRGRRMGHRGD